MELKEEEKLLQQAHLFFELELVDIEKGEPAPKQNAIQPIKMNTQPKKK